jgi:hypothetical protein
MHPRPSLPSGSSRLGVPPWNTSRSGKLQKPRSVLSRGHKSASSLLIPIQGSEILQNIAAESSQPQLKKKEKQQLKRELLLQSPSLPLYL